MACLRFYHYFLPFVIFLAYKSQSIYFETTTPEMYGQAHFENVIARYISLFYYFFIYFFIIYLFIYNVQKKLSTYFS